MGELEGATGGEGGAGAPPRLELLREVIVADAERLGVAVSLDLLCRTAAVHLHVAAVAVSVSAVTANVFGIDTLAAFGRLARLGEELQFTAGEGPSMEALSMEVLTRSGPLVVEGLGAPGQQARWPLFAPAAVEAGIAALYVFPLRIGAACFGVFVAYLDRPGTLSPTAMGDAMIFAALALELLLDHLSDVAAGVSGGECDDAGFSVELDGDPGGGQFGFGWAFDDRPEIHQATGMVSEQLGVDISTALLRLRARAFAGDRMLSELAADVVARRVRLDGDPRTEVGDRPR
jgi:hypothetical protein